MPRESENGPAQKNEGAYSSVAAPIAATHLVCYTTRAFSPRTCGFMPTYEYHCEKCKKGFEIFQSMKDSALTVCPKESCQQKKWGKGKVRRQLGMGAGLIFKGAGFYHTDYRSEGYKAAEKKDAPASSEAKAAESKTTEAKTTETKKADSAPAPSEKPKPPPKKD